MKYLISLILVVFLAGCAYVDVTKTAKGSFAPTNPNDVEILHTRPENAFIELASITAANIPPRQTAKLHNALRAKSAPLGANAVILLSEGINPNGTMWATGVAIRFK